MARYIQKCTLINTVVKVSRYHRQMSTMARTKKVLPQTEYAGGGLQPKASPMPIPAQNAPMIAKPSLHPIHLVAGVTKDLCTRVRRGVSRDTENRRIEWRCSGSRNELVQGRWGGSSSVTVSSRSRLATSSDRDDSHSALLHFV